MRGTPFESEKSLKVSFIWKMNDINILVFPIERVSKDIPFRN